MTLTITESSFPGTPAGVPCARDWLRAQLNGGGTDPDVVEAAALVLSELASNAVEHSLSGLPRGRYTVRLRRTATRLRLEVTDEGGEDAPTPAPDPSPSDFGEFASLDALLAVRGRGLALVGAFTDRWWTSGDVHGRTVTAELACGGGPSGEG